MYVVCSYRAGTEACMHCGIAEPETCTQSALAQRIFQSPPFVSKQSLVQSACHGVALQPADQEAAKLLLLCLNNLFSLVKEV